MLHSIPSTSPVHGVENNVPSLIFFQLVVWGCEMFSVAQNSVCSAIPVLYSPCIFQEAKGFPKSKGDHPLSQVGWRGQEDYSNRSLFPFILLLQGCYGNRSCSHD